MSVTRPEAARRAPARCSVADVHYVIMGCGRVGASLATRLDRAGHSVGIIDMDSDAFRRLPADFSGRRITGIGFDRDALIQAGIEDAYALAAVSSGDNSNVLAARVARENFGVKRVVARIYDPRRAEVYQRLGITTIATVRWTADQFLRRLLPRGIQVEYRDQTGTVTLASIDHHREWVGRPVSALEEATGVRIAFITRGAESIIPQRTTVVQEQDLMYVLARTEDVEKLQRSFTAAPKVED